MLTDQEKAWLERRKNLCVRCIHKARGYTLGKTEGKRKCNFFDMYPDESDYRDAAEFEARVALWLVHNGRLFEEPCSYQRKCKCPHIPHKRGYCNRWCKLMTARLAVEREMEKL